MITIEYPDWADTIQTTDEEGNSQTLSVADMMSMTLSHQGIYDINHDINQDVSGLLRQLDESVHQRVRTYNDREENLNDGNSLCIKEVVIVNAQSLADWVQVCSCEPVETGGLLSETNEHQMHLASHKFWNLLHSVNANAINITRFYPNGTPTLLRRGRVEEILRGIKGMDNTPQVPNKDKWRSIVPYQNVSIRKGTHLIMYILEDQDEVVRGTFVGIIHPCKEQVNDTNDWQVRLPGYENEIPSGYGWYGPKLNPITKEVTLQHNWLSSRNYKECKSCSRVVHRNHTVFAVKHARNGRFSICFICAAASTFGYSHEFNAFVMIHARFIDNEYNLQQYWRDYTHRPHYRLYERSAGTSRNSSRYQWGRLDWDDETDLSLPIEVRKFMNWAWDRKGLFEPQANVYNSLEHVGVLARGDDFIAQDQLEGMCTFDAFITGDTDGFIVPGVHINGQCDYDEDDCDVDHEYDDRETWFAHPYSIDDEEAEAARDGYHGNEIPYFFLKLYKANDWSEYLAANDRWRSNSPTNNVASRVVRRPLHVVRHGINNLVLARQDHDYIFPVWQVGMVERLMGMFPDTLRQGGPGMAYQLNQRALKPLGQSTWSHSPQANGSIEYGTPEWHRAHGPFYGMEIEMIGRRDLFNHDQAQMENTHRELVELFHPAWAEEQNQKVQLIYRVRDGSVDNGSPWGHELVSQAISLDAWHQVPQDFWELLRANYRAFYNADGERDRNNGIHIHIDHDAFTTAHLWAFLEIIYKFQDDVTVHENDWEDNILGGIAQRPTGQWAHWRRPTQRSGRPEDATHLTAIRRRHDQPDKYDGVNMSKDGTIELRYFNSTTVPGRVLSRPEFVEAIYRFAWHVVVQHGMEEYHYNNEDDYAGSPVERGLYTNSFKLYFAESSYREIVNDFWQWLLDTAENRARYANFIALAREENLFELSDIYPSSSNMGVTVDRLVHDTETYWSNRATSDTEEGER